MDAARVRRSRPPKTTAVCETAPPKAPLQLPGVPTATVIAGVERLQPSAVEKFPLLTVDPAANRAIMHDRRGSGIELLVDDGFVRYASFDPAGTTTQSHRQRVG